MQNIFIICDKINYHYTIVVTEVVMENAISNRIIFIVTAVL